MRIDTSRGTISVDIDPARLQEKMKARVERDARICRELRELNPRLYGYGSQFAGWQSKVTDVPTDGFRRNIVQHVRFNTEGLKSHIKIGGLA